MINLTKKLSKFASPLGAVLVCAMTALPAQAAKVIYFGQKAPEEFTQNVVPLFGERTRKCKNCELVNFTPYNKAGQVDYAALVKRVNHLPEDTGFVFFDFNLKANDETRALIEALNKRTQNGLVLVGAAGIPMPEEASGPLSRTVLGQVHGALIIGELTERDRLLPTGFYGPEMLTAIRSPRGLMGMGYSPLVFAASLAENWNKKDGQEWVGHLRHKKMKSRKLWLDLGDMF